MKRFRFPRSGNAVVFMVLTAFTVAAVVDAAAAPVSGAGTSTRTTVVKLPILTVAYSGGFVPQESTFTNYDRPVVDGFGNVITSETPTAVGPTSFLPRLSTRALSRAAVAALHAAAKNAGLADAGFDWGLPGTADVPGATITYRDPGGTVVTSSIASLGVGDETVPEPQRIRRAKVNALLRALNGGTAPFTGVKKPYLITALAIRAAAAPPGTSAPTKQWPLKRVRLTQAGDCVEVRGADALKLRAALTKADTGVFWVDSRETAQEWIVQFRPILPGGMGCSPAK